MNLLEFLRNLIGHVPTKTSPQTFHQPQNGLAESVSESVFESRAMASTSTLGGSVDGGGVPGPCPPNIAVASSL